MSLEAVMATWAPPFLLLLARCGGVVAFGPQFWGRSMPAAARAGLAGVLALMMSPALRGIRLPGDGLALAAILAGELAVGAVLGLAVRLTFAGIAVAGELAGVQMGLGLPAALDPQSMTQVSSVALLVEQIAILTFFGVGGHQTLLAALGQSLTLAPPLSVGFRGQTAGYLLGIWGAALRLAMRMAAPVGAAALATTVAMGLLNRVAPQVNIFMVSLPVSVGVGLLVLLAALPILGALMAGSFEDLPVMLEGLLRGMRRGL